MWFPGNRTYVIFPQLPDGGAFTGPYTFPQVQLSPDSNPYTTPGSNFAPSAGNAAEFSGLPDGRTDAFQVTNNTCSPYFLWLQVAQERPASASGPSDAGGD
jgi:hypothetical protein